MNRKFIPDIIFLCVAMLFVLGIVIFTSQGDTTEQNPISTPVVTPGGDTGTASGYTAADVATHKGSSSCWTIVNGNVYDVTSFISQHPGGSARILSICGIDGSSEFNDQHGGARRPEEELASFKIGALKK